MLNAICYPLFLASGILHLVSKNPLTEFSVRGFFYQYLSVIVFVFEYAL